MADPRRDTFKALHDFTPRLIPLQPKTKEPHFKLIRKQRGKLAAKYSLAQTSWQLFDIEPPTWPEVEEWLREEPNVNVGVILGERSGLMVCEEDNGKLPFAVGSTVVCESKRGAHYYFIWNRDYENTSHKDDSGNGWEIRANNCYMVGPGSVHESGHVYDWRQGHAPTDTTVTALLTDLKSGEVTAPPTKAPAPTKAKKIAKGARHNTLLKIAGQLRHSGLDKPEILAALQTVRRTRCEDPESLADSDINGIIEYVMSKPPTAAVDAPTPLMNACELMATKMPDLQWAVPGIMPEGIGLLCGKPKRRKSFLCLNAATAIAKGGKVLGQDVDGGKVLYISYEDGPRRLQKRLSTMLAGDSPPPDLLIAVEWPRANNGGLERLDNYLSWNKGIRLVIIDPLARFRDTPKPGLQIYYSDYEAIVPLKTIADRRNTSVLVVHHLRKSAAEEDSLDEISGSTGLTGAVDYLMLLKPTQESNGGVTADLLVTGRDVEEAEFALSFDPRIVTWQLVGSADDHRLSELRKGILNVLDVYGALGPRKVSELLGKNENTVANTMKRMSDSGILIRSGGKYRHATPSLAVAAGLGNQIEKLFEVSLDDPTLWPGDGNGHDGADVSQVAEENATQPSNPAAGLDHTSNTTNTSNIDNASSTEREGAPEAP